MTFEEQEKRLHGLKLDQIVFVYRKDLRAILEFRITEIKSKDEYIANGNVKIDIMNVDLICLTKAEALGKGLKHLKEAEQSIQKQIRDYEKQIQES